MRFFIFGIFLIFIFEIITFDFQFRYIGSLFNGVLIFSVVGGFLYAFPSKFITQHLDYPFNITDLENKLTTTVPDFKYAIISKQGNRFHLGFRNKLRHFLLWKDDIVTITLDNQTIIINGKKTIVKKMAEKLTRTE